MVAARIYGKDASWVRAGIISGWLPIGKATRNGQLVTKIEDMNSKYGRINFYISPKRFLFALMVGILLFVSRENCIMD